jgi:hypothetical protein
VEEEGSLKNVGTEEEAQVSEKQTFEKYLKSQNRQSSSSKKTIAQKLSLTSDDNGWVSSRLSHILAQ